MEIKTKRLILKPLGIQYLKTVFEYASDLETTKYMVWFPKKNLDETSDFLMGADKEWAKEKPEFYEFAVIFDGKHIGAVSIYLSQDMTKGEIGWIFNKKYWGQGFAEESAKALIDFAVDGLGLKKIIAHCDTENIGSYRLMEKLGMKRTSLIGGRKNRSSDEERMEYQYELIIR